MKVAIISDTHDNVPNLEKALAWMNKNGIEQIIHCGDLCATSMLQHIMIPQFIGDIYMVFGNVDDHNSRMQVAQEFPKVHHYDDVAEFEIDNKKIAVNHYPEKAKELAQTGKYDYSFYGHTHKPWLDSVKTTTSEGGEKECRVVNPGTLAGLFQKATFAVWDTKTGELELKVLERI